MKTSRISVSAAAHARSCAAGNGTCAFLKICGRQRSVGAEQARVGLGHDADGEQQRSRLARGAGDRQHGAADDAGQRGGQHDAHGRAPRPCAERRARLAEVGGNEAQHLLARAHDDRQHQARQGEGAGETRQAVAQHPDRVDEQAHHDRRHAAHHVGHQANELRERALLAVLVEVDRAEHAERHRDRRRRAGDQERADDRRRHARPGLRRDDRDVGDEEVVGEQPHAGAHDVEGDEGERRGGDRERHPHGGRRDVVAELASA